MRSILEDEAGRGDSWAALNRRYFPAETLLFLLFFVVAVVGLRRMAFNDPGSLWHIRVGDRIIQDGRLMDSDPFSFSRRNVDWRPQQWAAEIVMSLLHRAGGFDLLLVSMGVLLALFATALCRRFLSAGLHPFPAAALVLTGMGCAAFHFYARPHLASILLMGLIGSFIIDFERGRFGPWRWLILVPIFIVWTNLHGGVLGAIATLGLALIGWIAARLLRWDTPLSSWRIVAILAGVGILLLGSTLVNPYGVGMYRLWGSIVGSKLLPQIVTEHAPLRLTRLNGLAILGFGAVYLLALAGTIPHRPRVAWLLPLVWLALSFKSIRHGPLFCALALPALADLLPHTRWYRWLLQHGDTLIRPGFRASNEWRRWLIPIVVVLGMTKIPNLAGFDPVDVPRDLLPALQQYADTRPPATPIFNDANLGGFLIYFEPRLRVFADDRCELYGDAFLSDYVAMMGSHPERIEELRVRYGFDHALVVTGTPMDEYLKKTWTEVARGKGAALYHR